MRNYCLKRLLREVEGAIREVKKEEIYTTGRVRKELSL